MKSVFLQLFAKKKCVSFVIIIIRWVKVIKFLSKKKSEKALNQPYFFKIWSLSFLKKLIKIALAYEPVGLSFLVALMRRINGSYVNSLCNLF